MTCFLFSAGLFVGIYFSGSAERVVEMPLNVTMPQGYVASSLVPVSAEVVIKGREERIYMIDVSNIELNADFSAVDRVGVVTVPVVIDYKDMLEYINMADVSIFTKPATVKIYFDK